MIIDISVLDWTDWAGIVGAITGIVALIIQFVQYIHSKPKLRIEVTPECFVIRDEFKLTNENQEDGETSYSPATYLVISNTGQMAATILSIKMSASNRAIDSSYVIKYRVFCKLLSLLKPSPMAYSQGEGFMVDQTSKPPFIIESGHAWLAIIDAKTFRRNLAQYPFVFLAIKASHKKNIIKKRVKLNCYREQI